MNTSGVRACDSDPQMLPWALCTLALLPPQSSILRGAMEWFVPSLDEGVRRRLRARFGKEINPWLDEVPAVLATIRERWGLKFGTLIPQGSMSVVIRCDTADGRSAVLKIAPDRERLGTE